MIDFDEYPDLKEFLKHVRGLVDNVWWEGHEGREPWCETCEHVKYLKDALSSRP